MKPSLKHSYLLLPSLLGMACSSQTEQKTPNIILINLDDVGFGDFSCNGAIDYTTPNIDKMAAEGMKFTHFLAAQPISGASRAGLLTGCYPNRIGFSGAPGPNCPWGIHADEITIGELLKQEGYATAIYGKWHLGDAEKFLPLNNGFDEFYGLPFSNDMWPYHPQQGIHFNFPDLPTMEGNEVVGYNTDQTKFTTDFTQRTIGFIEKNQDKPFFIYLAHPMPHVPLAVSDKFKGKSKQGLFGDVMMEIDWSVGEVLKTLRRLDLEDNTLVILTSDNGPWANYGNHAGSTGGLREAKATTFEGGNRIPCIMYWKGKIKAGSICNKLSSNIDIFSTFAELTNAQLPSHKIDGVSLLPLINQEPDANPRESFVYYFKKNDLEAITDGTFKLIFPHKTNTHVGGLPGVDGQPGYREVMEITEPLLYDLRRDPGERYDVLEQHPDIAEKLNHWADNYRKDLGDDLTNIEASAARKHGRRN